VKFLGEVKPDFLETAETSIDKTAKTFKNFTFLIDGVSGFQSQLMHEYFSSQLRMNIVV